MKTISNIISTAAAAFLCAASAFLFACPSMEDGTYMNCHKANVTVALIACLMVILGIALFFIKNKTVSILLSGVIAAGAVICAIVPGNLIHLCMMPEMTCRAVFRPVDITCSVIILIVSVIRIFVVIRKEK